MWAPRDCAAQRQRRAVAQMRCNRDGFRARPLACNHASPPGDFLATALSRDQVREMSLHDPRRTAAESGGGGGGRERNRDGDRVRDRVLPPITSISKMADSPSPGFFPQHHASQSQPLMSAGSREYPLSTASSMRSDYYREPNPAQQQSPQAQYPFRSSPAMNAYPDQYSLVHGNSHSVPGAPGGFVVGPAQQFNGQAPVHGQWYGPPRPADSEYDSRHPPAGTAEYAARAPSPGRLDPRYGKSMAAPRVAPPITTAPFAPNPNAPSPTKGFPYAFPDPGASLPPPQPQLPAGQYYAGSGSPSVLTYNNPSRTSVDSYDRMSVRSLEIDDAAMQLAGVGPYSRSPELRQTHKIAERKRRKDMSMLYEDLKDLLPEEKGVKSSKHEILMRAISVLRKLNRANDDLKAEVNDLRQQLGMPSKKFPPITATGYSGNRESTAGSDDEDDDSREDEQSRNGDHHEAMDESK